LDAARKRRRFHPIVLALALSALVLATVFASEAVIVVVLAAGLACWGAAFVADRKRLTTTLTYNSGDEQGRKFDQLASAFQAFARCRRIWRVPLETAQTDWKRNAGAGVHIQRTAITPYMGVPTLIKSNVTFPALPLGKQTIYLTPDAVLVVSGWSIAALRYEDCEIDASSVRFVEEGSVADDAKIVGETWRFIKKDGGPDRRFAENRKLPICAYGQLDIKSSGGLHARLECSQATAARSFADSFGAMRHVSIVDQRKPMN
jgi:hypothetical protein